MKITILTIGSRGDVQPYLALGVGLKEAGHVVRLASHVNFEDFVRSQGLEFFPLAGDPRGILGGELGQRWLETSRNPFTFTSRMLAAARPVMWQILEGFYYACQGCDWIIYPVLGALPANSISEKLKIPASAAYLQPVHPTRTYPSPMLPVMPALGGWYNRLTYTIGDELFWRFLRPVMNAWRQEYLGLPPYPRRSVFKEWAREKLPCLYGISPHVLPRPPEWGQHITLTGYWFLDTQEIGEPPVQLVDFLNAGPPPVFIGFGSMTGRNPEEATHHVLEALAVTHQRGVLLTGWGGLGQVQLPDEVLAIDAAPFDWLFPQMAAVVHHGGAGTTAASVCAGIPAIVVPFFADQHFWAWRVEALGVGPKHIPRRDFSSSHLSVAIQQAVADPEIKRRAAELGKRVRAEQGVCNAVKALQCQFDRRI